MRVFSGRVHNGAIVPEDGVILPEGSQVTVLVDNGNDAFEVSAEEEAELLEGIAGVERGETVCAKDLLARLRRWFSPGAGSASGEQLAMLAKLSRCLRCGSTEMEDRPVEEFVRRGRYVVALRMPVNVCSDWGEQYFERDQVAMFEDVRRRLEHGDLEGFRVTGEVLEPVAASSR